MATPKKSAVTPTSPGLPSAFALFRPSWEALRLNITTFVVLILAITLVMAIVFSILFTAEGQKSAGLAPGEVVTVAVVILFGLIVNPALVYTQLRSAQGNVVSATAAFRFALDNFWRYYGLTLVVSLITIAGLVLLIVPGVFMIKRYLLAPYLLFDRNLSIREAMRESHRLAGTHSGAVWGVIGVTYLIAALVIIPVLGWIANAILSLLYYCAIAVRYRQISERDQALRR